MAEQAPKDSLDLQSSSSDSDIDMSSQEGAAAAANGEASAGGLKAVEETGGDLPNAIDRILERNRSEIMFELRRLKMGDRPVTGHGYKETLENFFQRQSEETVNEEHRPEAVVVEVQGLVERRPVSSVLQSAGFRRRLENALRSSFATVTSRQSTASPAPVQQSASSHSSAPSPRRQDTRTHPIAPPPPPLIGAGPNVAAMASVPLPPPPPPLVEEQPRVARAAAWLTQQTEPLPEDPIERQFHETYRDGIIEEVSELVQRQLVTSTLEGEFRTTLESRVASHLNATGADGPRVQEFIQNLPRSDIHQRNDFSRLGIHVPDQMAAALSDEVSVISATAAVHVSQNHVSRAVSLELASLRSQVSELKSMMRLSFDLQLDIQRAIHQEVSAAVNSALAGSSAAAPQTAATPSSRPVNDSSCLICLEHATDSVLYQCGHMCVCYTCGLTLKQRGAHCPMCRAPIRDIIRAYRCNQE